MKALVPKHVAIYGYKMVSRAVKALKSELGVVQILHEGSHYQGSKDKCVINYGSTKIPPNVMKSTVINKPTSVALCVDKLKFFSHLYDIEAPVSTPDWTNDQEVAKKWLENNDTLLARMSLTGHSGLGIKILKKGIDFVSAPLYTKYIPKQYEFRVHVLDGNIVDIQRKVLKKGQELTEEEKKIRNHANGWVFSRDPELVKVINLEAIEAEALKTVHYLDLDFGAVDIIYNKRRDQCFVLECNSAMGLEGTSVKVWGEAFRQYLNIQPTKGAAAP